MHSRVPQPQPTDGILFRGILNFLSNSFHAEATLYAVLAFVFLYIQAVIINKIMNDHRMMSKPNFLTGMSYMLITSFFSEWNVFSAPLLLNTVLVIMLSVLFKVYNQPDAKAPIFNIGLAIGISSFIFFSSVVFIFWVLIAILILRPFRLNELLLCLLGFMTPYYFYGFYLFMSDAWVPGKILPYLNVHIPILKKSIWLGVALLLLMIPFLTGGYFVQENLRRMLIQVRKGWSIFLVFLLVAIFIPFVNATNTLENWVMMALPFSTFHAATYFYPSKKLFPLLLFWGTVIFIVAHQYTGGW